MVTFEQMIKEADVFYRKNDGVDTDQLIKLVREWCFLPWGQAKAAIKQHMEDEGGFSRLDFDLLAISESLEEALDDIWGL